MLSRSVARALSRRAAETFRATTRERSRWFSSGAEADVDAVVIGAGVVGIAIARALTLSGREVVLLDGAGAIGTETSSRNSEVIHAGIYYPPGSLKAQLCVRGKHLLYKYCADRGVAHKQLGKIIVAASDKQIPDLEVIKERAASNGVNDLQLLSQQEMMALEPELRGAAALLSPSTGIVDSHGLMVSLLGDAESQGATLALHSRVVGGDVSGVVKRLTVLDEGSGEVSPLSCRLLVNAAGLHAPTVAYALQGLPEASVPTQHLARGCYFSLSGISAPFSRLVYPVPEDGGLGVHLTLDLGGATRLGPDVEWLPQGAPVCYDVDPRRGDAFYAAVRAYWPGLPDGALLPSYSGIRPKLSGPGQPSTDFLAQGPRQHGVAGLVNLFGIESPGLTSCLALAEHVTAQLLDDKD